MRPSFDELQFEDGTYRPFAKKLGDWLAKTNNHKLADFNDQARDMFYHKGVTFTVYDDADNTKRTIPFDIIPRVLSLSEWRHIERGCAQRIRALNAFLHDIYHEQAIVKAGIIPAEQVFANEAYEPWMIDIALDNPVYAHISGIDLIRNTEGQFCVLEDNLRTPSGVSYLLESRAISQQLLGEVYNQYNVLDVLDYPTRLKASLATASKKANPQIVVLTPGRFNSAYYEHVCLARKMNVPLVHGYDLLVENNKVYVQGITNKQQVDVIYRRIDDAFLDPLAFRADSILGIAGLMSAYRAGNVVIANAPGTGVADDKSLYPYVPQMIKFYLGEDAILPNIETYQCRDPKQLDYVLANLDKLVVKETQGSGGYGMLIGPTASRDEITRYRERILANPKRFIAQPTISLSTNPTFVGQGIAPRHIDLRPFILSHGDGQIDVIPGGLTRVAMVEGSLVVNSSQGGGVKDTWVIDDSIQAPAADFNQSMQPTDPIGTIPLLLLSQANDLVWLGRYGKRLAHYQALISELQTQAFDPQQINTLVKNLGLNPTSNQANVIADLKQHWIPQTLTAIEDNVQTLKSLLNPETVNLYHLLPHFLDSNSKDSYQIPEQLQHCNVAMQQEDPKVRLFWQLGMLIEDLHNKILTQQPRHAVIGDLVILAKELPPQAPWQALTRLINQLHQSNDTQTYWQLNQALMASLSEGVSQ